MKRSSGKNKKFEFLPCWIAAGFLLTLALIVMLAAQKYDQHFGIPFTSLLYTLTSSMEGADTGFVWDIVREALPLLALGIILIVAAVYFGSQTKVQIFVKLKSRKGIREVSVNRLGGIAVLLCSVCAVLFSLYFFDSVVGIREYYNFLNDQTTVYEDYYVDPLKTEIQAPEEKKNLIYIYLESMETQYASAEDGGSQPVNYISGLTKLAGENLTFSNSEKLGGFVSLPGTTWTMGALFATHTGLPFAFPVGENSMDEYEKFAGQTIGLGELLKANGYTQEFLCGSDARFCGRESFFLQHGGYDIYDYYSAIEDGFIAEDYMVWWGLEDLHLYEMAKSELLRLAAADEPFNLTMLTVDTHHVSGYVCSLCENEYEERLANVLSCADRQIIEFVEWIKQQDFFEDTVIVICGDHPRMDSDLIGSLDFYDRTMYNCFINAAVSGDFDTINRSFSSMDMFPTVVEALGFRIDGGRLGLGTSMFSGEKTLIEEKSMDFWIKELQKSSVYYVETFS